MANVLYEASFKFEFSFLIPVVMLIFIPIFASTMKKSYSTNVIDVFVKGSYNNGRSELRQGMFSLQPDEL